MGTDRREGAIKWKGFESGAPRVGGRLLSQIVDITGELGIAYERSVGFEKDFHVHDRDMLVCPRGASSMRIRTRAGGSFVIDAGDVLFGPKTCEHDDRSLTAVYDTIALYPTDAMLGDAWEAAMPAGAGVREKKARFAEPFKIRRSRWFSETLDRYFAVRVLDRRAASTSLAFLEIELVTEALRAATRRSETRTDEAREAELRSDDEGPFARAVRYIEANLFGAIDVGVLAKRSGASVSTLLRAFRDEAKITPYAYVKGRRLDEARRLLRRGRVRVKEVALLVGYADIPSFSHAYKARFGVSPRNDLG